MLSSLKNSLLNINDIYRKFSKTEKRIEFKAVLKPSDLVKFCNFCWIHEGYEICQIDLNCLTKISTSQVLKSINYSITNNSL
jgi:hypothetical protein